MNNEYTPEREEKGSEVSEHFRWFSEESKRLTTLCKEAVALGQKETEKELMREMYNLGHKEYELTLERIKWVRKYKENEKSEDLKSELNAYIKDMELCAKSYAKLLNGFMNYSLDVCSRLGED